MLCRVLVYYCLLGREINPRCLFLPKAFARCRCGKIFAIFYNHSSKYQWFHVSADASPYYIFIFDFVDNYGQAKSINPSEIILNLWKKGVKTFKVQSCSASSIDISVLGIPMSDGHFSILVQKCDRNQKPWQSGKNARWHKRNDG